MSPCNIHKPPFHQLCALQVCSSLRDCSIRCVGRCDAGLSPSGQQAFNCITSTGEIQAWKLENEHEDAASILQPGGGSAALALLGR